MLWEDQELNHTTPENKFPEIFFAADSLLRYGTRRQSVYLHVDQHKLDEMIAAGDIHPRGGGARIERLCLHLRLYCGLSPGGEGYPPLGVTHFWQDSVSLYAILYFSTKNDFFDIMVLTAPAPKA